MSTQRSRTFEYKPLDQFNDTACTVDFIDLPDSKTSRIAPVFIGKEKAPLYYHTTERKEIVDFSVIYIPQDNPSGRSLLPVVKEAVEKVLTKDYQPAVANVRLERNGATEEEVQINDCIITGGEILVDLNDYIRIKFYLQGLLNKQKAGVKK